VARVNVIRRKSIDEHVRIKIHWGHVKFEGQIYASMTVIITFQSPHTNNATKNMQLSPSKLMQKKVTDDI